MVNAIDRVQGRIVYDAAVATDVYLLVTTLCPTEAAGPIKLPFGSWT